MATTDFNGLPPAGALEDADVFPLQRGLGVDSTKQTSLAALKAAVGSSIESPTRIAVLGDSLSTQNYNMAPAWPAHLEAFLRQGSADVQVFNCAVAAHSFYRANTVVEFGTRTAVDHVIALNPDIVLIALGYNDTMTAVDARTVAQAQTDADTTISALRTALPGAVLIYLSQRPYDAVNFPDPGATTIPNKGTMPVHFNKGTGTWTLDIQDDLVTTTVQARLGDWVTLDTYLRANTSLDASADMDLWRIHRMGGALRDMLHINAAGQVLQTSYAVKALKTVIPDLLENTNQNRNDPDTLFLAMFTDTGDGWDFTPTDQAKNVMHSLEHLAPWYWCIPNGGVETPVSLTQAEYDALVYKDPTVLYVVTG